MGGSVAVQIEIGGGAIERARFDAVSIDIDDQRRNGRAVERAVRRRRLGLLRLFVLKALFIGCDCVVIGRRRDVAQGADHGCRGDGRRNAERPGQCQTDDHARGDGCGNGRQICKGEALLPRRDRTAHVTGRSGAGRICDSLDRLTGGADDTVEIG